jgi:hypothetical protein
MLDALVRGAAGQSPPQELHHIQLPYQQAAEVAQE